MGYEYSGYDITIEGADLGRDLVRGAVLSVDSNAKISDHAGTTTQDNVMVLLTERDDNDTMAPAVRVAGIGSCRTNAAVTCGDVLTIGATDRVDTTTSSNDIIVGIALASAGIGCLVPVLLHSGYGLYP